MQGEPSQDAPTAQSEKLWQHYQRPVKKGWPDDRLRMRRYEWLMELLRLDIPLETLGVATALAMLGNADGSRMVPADPRFLNAVDLSYRQAVGTHLARLRDLGMLTLTQRAGGRTGNVAHVFHLSQPVDPSTLPYRLDGDYERFEERPKGKAPVKAIEASKTARIDRKRTSAETSSTTADHRNGTSGEAQSDADDGQKHASSETDAATGFDRNPASVETSVDPTHDRNWSSGESIAATAFDWNQASSETPVDNSLERNPTSGETPGIQAPGRKQASSETEFHRKASTLSLEAQNTFTGRPASDSVVKPITPTTSVVSKGGDPTDARDPANEEDTEMSAGLTYADAKRFIESLPDDESQSLVQAAARELRAAGISPTAKGLIVRAAEIATRPEWDSA